jgi:hypothetical protein
MAMSAFSQTDIDIRWDDPSTLNTGPIAETTRASATITVTGVPDVLTVATGTITVVGPVPAGDTFSIDGIVVTSVAGAPTAADQFDGSSAVVATLASNIALVINAGTIGTFGVCTAVADAGIVTMTAVTSGTTGNDISLSESSGQLSVSGSTFTGGLEPSTLTIGGQVLSASTDPRTEGGMDFDVGSSSFDTAQSITDAVNDDANTFGFVVATADGVVITISAFTDGYLGDGIVLASDSVAFTLSDAKTVGGSGVACSGKSNSEWTILGVNVYRSDTGDRGPYFRVNRVPIGTNFYRDRTGLIAVEDEVVRWDVSWIYQGDAPNNKLWRFQTRHIPIAKATDGNKFADSPTDVTVYIDGSRAQIAQVFGKDGQVDLSPVKVWDPSTETWTSPPLPKADGTSAVTVNYSWRRDELLTNLDNIAKVFYRVTTVALDVTGTTPSGLVETPLGYAEPIAAINSEKVDYIWKEAIRRNRWILEQGGERVKLFIRRVTGTPCGCAWDERLFEFSKQPLNNCLSCFGTGFLGGYEGPIDLIVGPDDAERRVAQTSAGRRLEHTYEVWTGPSPMLSQRDFVVKQNGERYSIGPVRRTGVRGVVLQQAFQIGYLDSADIRYQVPLVGLAELAWPETRYTRPEDSPCVESDPHPVGFDYQATPMGTDVAKIPDAREQRGRTPVWANITYGGKGPGTGKG